ncbi:rhomboid family intramembrane serine protease [Deinococcus rubellus]|uniref:Rhomboid family intramembrane serine protease n=1 Tax=Deinococcus rubellus TaxID=1889240 RepID=A0ABY5YF24_9DEIO|nr:rhomboid family intramembrane serine protease [Deinococcus rubellus]UWX63445.1 rhomboid family intramembrane serine protease [Deinococcus rubellus]
MTGQLAAPPEPLGLARRRARGAGLITAALLAVMWGQELTDQLVFGGRLDAYGIVPRHLDTLSHIFTAPFLHGSFTHLIGNSLPLAILAFLNALRGAARFVLATLIIMVIGGALVWLLGRGGNHLGASELVFGYFGLLLASAWHERRTGPVIAALVALLLYGGALWGVLPRDPRISWESHLFGFIAGMLAARWLSAANPKRPRRPATVERFRR